MGESQRLARDRAPPTVIRLPAEIDATNARRIGEELGSAFASGVATVITDMTATTFCDSSGTRELLLAHHKAAAGSTELRIVMPSAGVRRFFPLTGLDQVLAIYPSLAAGRWCFGLLVGRWFLGTDTPVHRTPLVPRAGGGIGA
jgi:anti-sigma B factor antagonist